MLLHMADRLQNLSQTTETAESLRLFRIDYIYSWEENLPRVINAIKTICDWENSWITNCWRQEEHFEEALLHLSWFYTHSYISALDPWRDAAEGRAVGLLQDAFLVPREAKPACSGNPPFSGVERRKLILLKNNVCQKAVILMASKPFPCTKLHPPKKKKDETNPFSEVLSEDTWGNSVSRWRTKVLVSSSLAGIS